MQTWAVLWSFKKYIFKTFVKEEKFGPQNLKITLMLQEQIKCNGSKNVVKVSILFSSIRNSEQKFWKMLKLIRIDMEWVDETKIV